MKRKTFLVAVAVLFIFVAAPAFAKIPPNIARAINSNYRPAEYHKALATAYEQPNPEKLRGYVVIMQGGIPAERARFFITWDDYDYRGVVVDMNKGGQVTTRTGSPYTYLKKGDVMAIVDAKEFNNGLYLKLMSADVYVPENRQGDKHHSRVTLTLGLKLSKAVLSSDNAEEALRSLSEWAKPFSSESEAKAYAMTIREGAPIVKEVKEKAPAKTDTKPQVSEEKVKELENKINEAKKQMEEAEKEMQKMKSGK